jgi:5-oxoprolinase (ATP-hydrolysing)
MGDRAALRHLRPVPAVPGPAGAAAAGWRSRARWTADGRVVHAAGRWRRCARAARASWWPPAVQAVAICFLHAYANPAHEQAVGRTRRARVSQLALSLVRSVVARDPRIRARRHDLRQRLRAAADGALPRRLQARARARGFAGALRLMHSAGGLCMSPADRARLPDPPARVRPRRRRPGHRAVRPRRPATRTCISFDMGGTTAKACADRGWPRRDRADDGGGARPPLQARLRPADQGAGRST